MIEWLQSCSFMTFICEKRTGAQTGAPRADVPQKEGEPMPAHLLQGPRAGVVHPGNVDITISHRGRYWDLGPYPSARHPGFRLTGLSATVRTAIAFSRPYSRRDAGTSLCRRPVRAE